MFNSKLAIKNDAWLRILLVNSIVLLILATILLYQYPDTIYYVYVYGAGLVILIALPLRYLYLKNFGVNTEMTVGKIIKSTYYRGSRILKYEYKVNGQEYKKSIWTNYTSATKNLERDALTDIMFKSNNPKCSLIADLYFDKIL